MSNEVTTIVRTENLQLIVQKAPQVYNDNMARSERCLAAGNNLIAEALSRPMTDELDQRLASYLEKTRKTVKVMNEQRAPFTKLFDEVRSAFTTMENSIDVTKNGTVPFQIQQVRNQYVAQKRAEEEKRRQAELAKAQRQQALDKYEADVERAFREKFSEYSKKCIYHLDTLNGSVTLDTYESRLKMLKEFPASAPANLFAQMDRIMVFAPQALNGNDTAEIQAKVQARLTKVFHEQYQWEVGDYRQQLIDAMPAKRAELERMAAADAEEQERMRQELAAKEAAEKARLEEERQRKAAELEAQQKMQAQAQQAVSLFGQAQVTAPSYQPKTSVKKKCVPLDAEGVIAIVSFWWSKEGQHMDVEDLKKMFKKQITATEKYANDKSSPEFINSPHIRYEEEVKAR